MDKNEYRIKTEQMLGYMKERSYDKAMEIADAIDWNKVKNASVLCVVGEIYERNGEYQKSRDILLMAYERAAGSRKIVYRLGTLALKANDTKEATDYYEEFVAMAPKDPNQYILRYKILKKQEAPVSQKIEALEEFKKAEYVEKWAYELAKLYHEAGMVTECLEECDDLILWFSEGKYVYQAMELKMKYKPLTPLQQEKYIHRDDAPKVVNAEGEEPAEEAKPEVVEEAPVEESEPEVVEEAPVEESEPEVVAEEEPVEEFEPEVVEEAPVEESEPEVVAEEEPVEESEPEVAEEEEPVEESEPEEVEEEEPVADAGAKLAEAIAAGVDVSSHTATVGEVIDAAETVAEEEPAEVVKPEGPTPSLEEILLGWEEKQKENAQIIQAEQERVQSEKAERELEKKNAEDDMDSILPDDIRQLMEELEAESSERQAQKVKTEIISEPVLPVEEAAEPVAEEPVPEQEEEPAEEFFEEEFMEEEPKMDSFEEIEEIEETDESEGIKLGDTQAIAISAKALMNDKEVEVQEEPLRKPVSSSPFDTGFIVQGRYDLDAQSEIGLRAGLTEEQKKLFSYFVPVRGMSEQIVDVLEHDRTCRTRYGTSRTANILIVGRKGSGKTVLAVDIVKAIQKTRNLEKGKVGIVTAESLNKKDVSHIVEKLYGGALIIEKAAKLNKKTISHLNELMEEQTGEMLVILEEERRPLDKMLSSYPAFKKKFTSRLELPVFINDELVTFAQTYAKENGFKMDDMGILALYSRIDLLQREESVVTVADVKDIMDGAIEKAQRTNFKSFIKKLFKKNKDESARIILTEQDFK